MMSKRIVAGAVGLAAGLLVGCASGGAPLGHRHVWWNFVSSSRERIQQAKDDWANGRFPTVPGDSDEFIPLPNGQPKTVSEP